MFNEVLDALKDANARIAHASLSKKSTHVYNATDTGMRDYLWDRFLEECDRALESVGGDSMAMIVHDMDSARKNISRILSAHVERHAGCRMMSPMRFHSSFGVNAQQGADIVAYIERHASKPMFEELHKRVSLMYT